MVDGEQGGENSEVVGADKDALLRREYHSQTARIPWQELQTWYARGSVIQVSTGMDLVEVAVQLALDNTLCFERWIEDGCIGPVADDQALSWHNSNQLLWAVVAPPWVLVQQSAEIEGKA